MQQLADLLFLSMLNFLKKLVEGTEISPPPPPPPPPAPIPASLPVPPPPPPPREKPSNVFAEPLNDFERALLAKVNRQIHINDFLPRLFAAELHVLVVEGESSLGAQTQVFCTHDPSCVNVCAFSDLKRALPIMNRPSEVRYKAVPIRGMSFFLDVVRPGDGVIINPYWDVNLQWGPDQILAIKDALSQEP